MSAGLPPPEPPFRRIVLTPAQLKSRRARNIAIGLAIGAVVLLFYVLTIVKVGPGVVTGGDMG